MQMHHEIFFRICLDILKMYFHTVLLEVLLVYFSLDK